jgi:hypothetical protein
VRALNSLKSLDSPQRAISLWLLARQLCLVAREMEELSLSAYSTATTEQKNMLRN